jgi:hypothetical protein
MDVDTKSTIFSNTLPYSLSLITFQRNVLLPSSGPKCEIGQICMQEAAVLFDIFVNPEDGGNKFFLNFR